MDKKFFEVFPNLEVDGNVREWLEAAFVTRVTCNRDRTLLRVYLSSDRWIHKKHIFSWRNRYAASFSDRRM